MAQDARKDGWRIYVPFTAQVERRLLDADLLLYHRPGSLFSRAIRVVGQSPYSHAAMVAWLDGRAWRLEVREWYGGRHDPLVEDVREASGYIDVFRPAPYFYTVKRDGGLELHVLNRKLAVEAMLEVTRPGRYGYRGVLYAGLTHMPLVRWFLRYSVDDQLQRDWPPFCSQAYAYAIRRAFVDPVPFRPDFRTEPGDLARSPLLANYLFTLVDDTPEERAKWGALSDEEVSAWGEGQLEVADPSRGDSQTG